MGASEGSRVDVAMRNVVAALAVLVLAAGCSHIPGIGSKSAASPSGSAGANPNSSALARASGGLDAQVPAPAGFPADVPVYPKARLTAGAQFVSTGQVAYGMEWETTDSPSQVVAFYEKELTTGDWALNETSKAYGGLLGTISRRSNTQETGTIAVNNDVPITVIALSLKTAP